MKLLATFLVSILVMVNAYGGNVDTVFVHSDKMNKDIRTLVITPKKAKKSHKGVKYPVIYLLHGATANCKYWLEKVKPDLPAAADRMGVIFVAPDAYNSWYIDSPINKGLQFETFTSAELIKFVDANYPTVATREGRAVMGLSMGGHGALYLAFRHKDVYSACGSMSGGVDFRGWPNAWEIKLTLGKKATHQKAWDDNVVVNQINRIANGDLDINIDCGEGDFFINVNKNLHQLLLDSGIDHDFTTRPGKHDPNYWQNAIDFQLLFFAKHFKKAIKQ